MSEEPTTSRAVYSATPTIRVKGQEYAKVRELLLSMEMRESEGGMSALELRFSNLASEPEGDADLAFPDDEIFSLGAEVAVYGGDQDSPIEIFRGKVTGIEAEYPAESAPELTILAEDVFQQARMARRTKIYDNFKISDFAKQLAGPLGLKEVVTGLTDDIGTQFQLNESDLAFFRRVLARYDADLQVVGTELHVSKRADVQRGTITLELHSQLRRVRVLSDLAHQVTKVTVSGWDYVQGQSISGTSTGVNAGPGSGKKGSDALGDSNIERAEHISHIAVRDGQEAQAVADTAFDHRARRFVQAYAITEGNPSVRVGTHVTLAGLGRYDNTYYVVRARHRYDMSHGYETDFDAECAFLGQP